MTDILIHETTGAVFKDKFLFLRVNPEAYPILEADPAAAKELAAARGVDLAGILNAEVKSREEADALLKEGQEQLEKSRKFAKMLSIVSYAICAATMGLSIYALLTNTDQGLQAALVCSPLAICTVATWYQLYRLRKQAENMAAILKLAAKQSFIVTDFPCPK